MWKGKRRNRNDNRHRQAYRLALVVFALVFCASTAVLYYHLIVAPERSRQMTEQLKEEFPGEEHQEEPSPTAEPAGEKSLPPLVDLSALQEQYPDVKGWIYIPDTEMDYPVLQSSQEQPEYYLRRNYKGEYDINGSLFLQWDCSVSEGANLVIYGHNMKSGVMFGNLDQYADPSYCQEHPAVLFQTADGVSLYTVVAVLKADVSMFPFQQTLFQEPDGLLDYLTQAKALELFDNGERISPDAEQVLTLVTCSYEWDGARNIVVAVRD